MKVNINVIDNNQTVVKVFEVTRTEKIDRDVIALHMEMMRDGSWKLLYDKTLFPSLATVSRLEIELVPESDK